MSGKTADFGDKKINKSNFCKILISKKEPYSKNKTAFKYFIGYDDNDVIRPLCINFPN